MIVQLTEKASAVKLPEGATDIECLNDGSLMWLNSDKTYEAVDLPPGQWTALGFSDAITEETAAKVVKTSAYKGFDGKIDESTRKYIAYGERPDIRYNTALESLQSLLKSKGCTDDRWFIILKQE